MARLAVAGRRAFSRFTFVYRSFSADIIDVMFADITSHVEEATASLKGMLGATLGLSAAALAVSAFLTALPLIIFIFENNFRVSAMAKLIMETLFSGILRQCQLALGLLGAVLIAQFVIAVMTMEMGEQAAKIVMTARSREALVLRSMAVAIKINASVTLGNGFELSQQMSLLSEVRQQLADSRNTLYFADSATSESFGTVGSLSSAQRLTTFGGGSSSLDSQFLVWLSALDALASTTLNLATVVNPTNSLANRYVFTSATRATVTDITNGLLGSVFKLTSAVRSSNDQYDADMKTSLQRSVIPDVILFVAVVLGAAVQFYGVFMPVAGQLHEEERGTRLMLNMIPQNVREAVPKIVMYLESGVVVEDESEHKIYGRCPHAVEFLAVWGHTDDQRSCFDKLNESPIGQVLIDAKGTVVFANRHIPDLLGYDDLEGRNVSVLVDEPLRSLHDGFLRRFVTQGTSRLVGGGRDVLALRKGGDKVHLFLNLDEAVSHDGGQYFLGGMEKYSVDDVKAGSKKAQPSGGSVAKSAVDIPGVPRTQSV
jgi:PAS domain S-box-containing protein